MPPTRSTGEAGGDRPERTSELTTGAPATELDELDETDRPAGPEAGTTPSRIDGRRHRRRRVRETPDGQLVFYL